MVSIATFLTPLLFWGVLLANGCLLWGNDPFTRDTTFSSWNIIAGPWGEDSLSYDDDPCGSGEKTIRIFYKNGSYSKTAFRGTAFYSKSLFPGRNCVRLGFDVYFEPGFDFVRGGKLPGIWGGSTSCSGGRNATDCFSTRFVWRAHGDGEVYAYIPDNQADDFCTSPDIRCNFNFGHSIGRAKWRYPVGQWFRIEQEVKLNDAPQRNGYVKVWLDGVLKQETSGLLYRNGDNVKIDGIVFSTFFGGSDESWASTADTYTYFKNFQLSTCGVNP
ncbi:hypothetical protein SNE40_016905 [Patella caerulea]|uniref:Polysaccharide lyase 14 domain-containing protein n=1 Tax=Patella caerulea TaxID=87958 RepID=A0AAN8PPA0_PATCE